MDLHAARAELLADFVGREKYLPEQFPPGAASNSPIAFICDDRIKIVGGCVPKVLAALQSWREPPPTATEDEFGNETTVPYADEYPTMYRRAMIAARRLAGGYDPAQTATGEIDVSSQDWNCLNYLLGKVGCSVIVTQGHR